MPSAGNVKHGFERGEIRREQAPLDAALDHVKNGVENSAATHRRPRSAYAGTETVAEKPIGHQSNPSRKIPTLDPIVGLRR